MVLYGPASWLGLKDFGILIPLEEDRVTNILRFLAAEPQFSKFLLERSFPPLSWEALAMVHDAAYLKRLAEDPEAVLCEVYELKDPVTGEYHRYDPKLRTHPWSELVRRLLEQAAMVVEGGRLAVECGWTYVLGGGAHHAYPDHGSGFCLVNDIMLTVRILSQEGRAHAFWIIDTDAHRGDGTAAAASGDPSIRTLSIHMAHGWPLDDPERARNQIPSTVDIPIEPGEEEIYLPKLLEGLEILAQGEKPDLAIVVAGSDPYAEDVLPSTQTLRLSRQSLLERDVTVHRFLEDKGVSQLWLMAGGYGPAVWEIHAQYLQWALSRRGS